MEGAPGPALANFCLSSGHSSGRCQKQEPGIGREGVSFRTSLVSLGLWPVFTLYILLLPQRIKQATNYSFLSFK